MRQVSLSSLLAIVAFCNPTASLPTASNTAESISTDQVPSSTSVSIDSAPLRDSHPISGPVESAIFADPSVVKVGDTYYAYATQNKEATVPIATSPDFENWTVLGKDALPEIGAWGQKGENQSIWAPDVIQASEGQFVMYYTSIVDGSTDKKRCIGTATASSPEGPFQPSDTPVVCPPDGTVIDPCGYIAANGSLYLLHKVVTSNTSIVLQPMSSDGLSLKGPYTTLVSATEAEGWNTEAPSLVYAGGGYVLFFSTGYWDSTSYTVSVATAPDIGGPYTKRSTPLLGTGSVEVGLVAPGGADVLFASDIVDDADGGQSVHIVSHTAESKTFLGQRHLWMGMVNIKGSNVEI